MDEFVKWVIDHFQGELAVIAQAPGLFMAAVLITGVVLYFVIRGFFSERLETNGARIAFLGEQLAEYKSKLSGATPAEAAKELASLRADLERSRAEISMLVDWHKYHTSDRRLTPEQTKTLSEKLAAIGQESLPHIEVCSVNQPEPQQYALDIRQAFKDAGLDVRGNFLGPLLLSSPDEVGVLLVVDDDKAPPPHAIQIMEAFRAARVAASFDKCESPLENRCVVMVSYKPPMTAANSS